VTAAADLAAARAFYAREVEIACGIRTAALTQAFATVPRERFLGPGPWLIRGEGDLTGPRTTPDADPRHVYHNVSVAIDASRQLFNGAPSVLGALLDALALAPGGRVLHVGCGTGYYSAIAAHVVGPNGRVDAIDVDQGLVARAAGALADWPWVQVRGGDGSQHDAAYDAIIINAGVTHPLESWLDALTPGAHLVLPLTVAMPPGSPIGKGMVLFATRTASGYDARFLTMVMIYNAQGLRDTAVEPRLASAMRRGDFHSVARLRRDPHDETDACWCHAAQFCLSRR
jgi:protein-L-isoaspartate(D-aspartate) O-methyltransferase